MDFRKEFLVEPGKKLKLSAFDPAYHGKHFAIRAQSDERSLRRRDAAGSQPSYRLREPAFGIDLHLRVQASDHLVLTRGKIG